jgi:hypothetical protein
MTINNPLPYECQPDTTPDIWGVYPENAMLRQQIAQNEELLAKNDQLLETMMKTIVEKQHEISTLNDRIGFNDAMRKNQFHAINTFFKWVMEHYQVDKQDDIWEMLDGMFEDGLLTDPRKRVYRMQVARREVDNYEIEFPWDMTEDRAQEILRSATLAGEFTRTDFQDITQLGGVAITVVAHEVCETEWTVWNRGQINNNESPW